ncbi:MAG: hypothetical protein KAV87_49945, partial [Desulfobacteraceae bacterium]|nr:hypothetical protein [Desulfobacteraceae bacterium]
MKKNTGIRVEAVKEINDKGIGYRITAIVALPKDQLPDFYLKSDRAVIFLDSAGDINFRNPSGYLIKNSFYTKKEMIPRLAHIAAAGQHLADVNQLAKNRKAWQGKVVFVDGIDKSAKPLKPSKTIVYRSANEYHVSAIGYCNAKGHIKPLKPAKTVLNEKPEPEQLYKITDGSWHLCSTDIGMEHFTGLAHTNSKYRI